MPIASAITAFWRHNGGFGTDSPDDFGANNYVARRAPAASAITFAVGHNSDSSTNVGSRQQLQGRVCNVGVWQGVCKTPTQIASLATKQNYPAGETADATFFNRVRKAAGGDVSNGDTVTSDVGPNLTADVNNASFKIHSVAGPDGTANDALQFGDADHLNGLSTATVTALRYNAATDYTAGLFVYFDVIPTTLDRVSFLIGQASLEASNNIGPALYVHAWATSGHRYLNCDFGNGPNDTNLAGNAVNDGALSVTTGQWYYVAVTYKASTGVLTVYLIPYGGSATTSAFTLVAAVDTVAGKIGTARKFVAIPQWIEGTSGYDVAKTSPLEVLAPTNAIKGTPTKFSHGFWYYVENANPAATQTMKSFGANVTTNAMWFAFQISVNLAYFVIGNGVSSFQYASKAITTGWHHFVGTFSAAGDNKPHLWVDGVEGTINGTAGFTVAIPAGATLRACGSQNDLQQCPGRIDLDFHADNYQCDATDIATLYNGGAGWAPPVGYTLTAASGSFTLTGQSAGLLVARRLTAAAGSYTLTGQSANLLAARRLSAASGSFTLTGQPANLAKGRTLTADAGTFALTGQPAALRRTLLLPAGTGTFTLTGTPAALLAGRRLIATAGTYALAGQPATLTITSSGPLPVLRVAVTCTLRRRGAATCVRR